MTICKLAVGRTFLAVNYQLDVVGKAFGNLRHNVAAEQFCQRAAVRGTKHEYVHAQSRSDVDDRSGRIIADGIHREHTYTRLPREIDDAIHNFRRLPIVLPAGPFPGCQRSGQRHGKLFDVQDV